MKDIVHVEGARGRARASPIGATGAVLHAPIHSMRRDGASSRSASAAGNAIALAIETLHPKSRQTACAPACGTA